MTATDLEYLAAFAHTHDILPCVRALDSRNLPLGDQCIAMDAHEVGREFLGERLERLVDQALAALVSHRDVLLVCEEVVDVRERNEPQLLTEACADLFAPVLDAC